MCIIILLLYHQYDIIPTPRDLNRHCVEFVHPDFESMLRELERQVLLHGRSTCRLVCALCM